MSRRDDQFGDVKPTGAWIEVMGRNMADTCTITIYEYTGIRDSRGTPLSDTATVGLDASQLRALAARLVAAADALESGQPVLASSGQERADG